MSLVERRWKIFHYLAKSWAKQSKIRNVLEDGKEFTSQKKSSKNPFSFFKNLLSEKNKIIWKRNWLILKWCFCSKTKPGVNVRMWKYTPKKIIDALNEMIVTNPLIMTGNRTTLLSMRRQNSPYFEFQICL